MPPPQPLVETFKWAQKSLDWCSANVDGDRMVHMDDLPFSTWFSGYGCAELAFSMLNSAKKSKGGKSLVSSSYQFEISAKARSVASQTLPRHCCQHIDIMRCLTDDDRKALLDIEKTSENVAANIWKFLQTVDLADGDTCSKHRLRHSLGLGQNNHANLIEEIQ